MHLFLLEMSLVAGKRLRDLVKVGPFLVLFGILMPLFHGFLGAWLGHVAGLNLGGCTVFAAIVSSASSIAAPPTVRLTTTRGRPDLLDYCRPGHYFPIHYRVWYSDLFPVCENGGSHFVKNRQGKPNSGRLRLIR